jgi:hypothetical protein
MNRHPPKNPWIPGYLVLTLAATLVFLLAGCSDPGSPKPRGPGSLQVELISPNGAEGSAVFELQTEASLGVVSAVGGDAFQEHHTADQVSRVVVVMNVPGTVSFKIRTGNVGDVPEVRVLQVADGSDLLRESTGGYTVEVTPLPDGGS